MFRTVGKRTRIDPVSQRIRKSNQSSADKVFGQMNSSKKNKTTLSPMSKSKKAVDLKFDISLLMAVITLVIFGLVMVYSASYDYSLWFYEDPSRIFTRQLIWLVVGILTAIGIVFVNYHHLQKIVLILMFATIVMLVGVLIIGNVRNNAARTLYEGSIQPSEMAKMVAVIYLSVWLYARRNQLGDISFGLIPLAVILGILGGLIALQPDFSAVVTIFFLGGVMFFLAGGELRQIGALLLIMLVVGYLLFLVFPTGSARINDYMAGLKDPTEGSYHVRRSFEAFVRGGWFGVGIGKGETKLTGLPVPHTDSIFAVVGEETGVIGAIAMVCLFSLLLWRGLVIARNAPDELGALLAAGLTIWIATEAFINMAVMVNLLPFAGNALPFISSGGSSLVISLAAIGIILNISRLSAQRKGENGKLSNAVIDLRRRDWRRRISSHRRVAGIAKRSREKTAQ